MRYLQDVTAGTRFAGEHYIQDNIEWFLSNLEELGLTVTSNASWRLREFLQNKIAAKIENLDQSQASELRKIMSDIRLTLDAEIDGIFAFITTSKRINTESLLGDMASLFAPNMFSMFPDIAKHDFYESGKCIAFELPTAAAFHILRATEANLRYYYKEMIKQGRIKSELWGPIVQDLMTRTKTKKYVTLNNHLDHIRLSFRNPTQHPEAIYDIHEVQDLLSVCIDANNRMFKVLQHGG